MKTKQLALAAFSAALFFYLAGTFAVILLEDGRQIALGFINFAFASALTIVGLITVAENSRKW